MDASESFAILDDARWERKRVSVTTKERGVIAGKPYRVDEFETDEDRLGYCLITGEYSVDTVFLDEIISIEVTA
jgi:hypothetical protein